MDKYLYAIEQGGSVPEIKTIMAYSYDNAIEKLVNLLDPEEKIYVSHNWEDISQQLYDIYDINISKLYLFDEF